MADELSLESEDLMSIEEVPAEPVEVPLTYDESSPNIVVDLAAHKDGKEFLKKFSAKVCDDFKTARDSMEEYRERRAQNYMIYAGKLPPKGWPWENSANCHIPILLEGITRLGSRLFAELFGDRDQVAQFTATGPDDVAAASMRTLHTNWQINNEIPDFKRQHHRGILEFFAAGDVTCHSFYDAFRRQNRHEIITCDDFFVPYVFTSTMPDWSDVPYKVRLRHYYDHELHAMRDSGAWDGVDEVIEKRPPAWSDEQDAPLRDAVAEVSGIEMPASDGSAPFRIYEYHGWANLPGSTSLKDKDGKLVGTRPEDRKRPVCAFVDPKTKAVLRLYINEKPDWRDEQRQQRQIRELQQYREASDAVFQVMADQELAGKKLAGLVPLAPEDDPADLEARMQIQIPTPQAPEWYDEASPAHGIAPVRSVPNEMFSHGVCIEAPSGSGGLSYGDILADFNKAADTVLSQFVDAATLANGWGLIVPESMQFDNGAFQVAPGRVNRVTGMSGPEIRNSIVELKAAPANEQLVRIVEMMQQYGNTFAPTVLSGEPGKSGETWRGISFRTEQALKQLSVAGLKYAEFMTQILRNNCELNAVFLDDDQIIHVLDHAAGDELRELRVGRQLYAGNYRVSARADMRFTSQAQKIAEADELAALPQQIPPLQGDLAFLHAVAQKQLRARGAYDLLPLLGPSPPPPTTPFGLPPPPPPGMALPAQQPRPPTRPNA